MRAHEQALAAGDGVRAHDRVVDEFRGNLLFDVMPVRGSQAHQSLLRGFIERTPEFADVLPMLPTVDDEPVTPASDGDAADGPQPVPGHVYLVRSGKFHKIGRSNDHGRRTYEIGLQLPEQLEVVHTIETDDAVGIERYWHERCKDRRRNGEWFLLSKADVAAFKRRRVFM